MNAPKQQKAKLKLQRPTTETGCYWVTLEYGDGTKIKFGSPTANGAKDAAVNYYKLNPRYEGAK
jgi:hypothetical protein